MHAHQLFQNISPELTAEILTAIREKDRAIYRTSIGSLAAQKKLRPVFIQKKPLEEQIRWAHKTLQLKLCDEMAEHILQVWLLGCHPGMLIEFLDDMGIKHDGKGSVDDLPEELDSAKLSPAVDGLLKNHPAPRVSIYLRLFQLQRPGGWEALGKLIDSDARLALSTGDAQEGAREEDSKAE